MVERKKEKQLKIPPTTTKSWVSDVKSWGAEVEGGDQRERKTHTHTQCMCERERERENSSVQCKAQMGQPVPTIRDWAEHTSAVVVHHWTHRQLHPHPVS